MTTIELIPEGAPLANVTGLSAAQRRTLADAWLTTAQELVALAATPEAVRLNVARALGVDLAGLERLAQAARAAISPTRSARSLALAQQAVPANYGRGALLDEPADVLAARLQLPAYRPEGRPVLPPSVNLLDQLPPLRNQGGRGTCVAHAVLAVREQLEVAAGSPLGINLSEQFVYWWCKQNDGIPATSGTYVIVGMRCLSQMGAPAEALWPYVSFEREGDQGQGPPPAAAAQGDPALRTLRTQEFNRTDITGIKTCLAEGRAVAFSIPVFDTWYHSSATSQWGKITLPVGGEPEDGGHAMALVGYQDDPAAPGGGYFLVRNSWQPWAYDGVWQEGYGYIPYAYISRHATAVFSATRLSGAGVHVRDSATDTGARPLAAPTWNSPDVWLRHDYDLAADHQPPQPGEINLLHARVRNPGPAYAYEVQAAFYVAPLAPYVPADAWQRVAMQDAASQPPGQMLYGPTPWQPSDDQPQMALQVRVTRADQAAEEPNPVTASGVAERRLWIVPLAVGQEARLGWRLAAPERPGMPGFAVDRAGLPAAVAVSEVQIAAPAAGDRRGLVEDAIWGALTGGAVLAAGQQAFVTVTLTAPLAAGARPTFVITQLHDAEVVGRLTVQIHPLS
jgi:hypothetical protein